MRRPSLDWPSLCDVTSGVRLRTVRKNHVASGLKVQLLSGGRKGCLGKDIQRCQGL